MAKLQGRVQTLEKALEESKRELKDSNEQNSKMKVELRMLGSNKDDLQGQVRLDVCAPSYLAPIQCAATLH